MCVEWRCLPSLSHTHTHSNVHMDHCVHALPSSAQLPVHALYPDSPVRSWSLARQDTWLDCYQVPHWRSIGSLGGGQEVHACVMSALHTHPTLVLGCMCTQVLKSFKWRCESSFPPAITLQGWSLTPAVLHELKALPDLGFTVSLDFTDCDWSVCTDYEGLASWVSALPACYALGTVRSSDSHGACTGRHLQALCLGAAQRPSGLAKTVLSFSMASCYQTPSDAERSAVHRYIEEQGLGEKVEVDWDPSEHLCVHLC